MGRPNKCATPCSYCGCRATVVFDEVEGLDDATLDVLFRRAKNFKHVRGVFFLTSRVPNLGKAPVLNLAPLDPSTIRRLFESHSQLALPPESLDALKAATAGNPRAIETLANILKATGLGSLEEVLRGDLYDLKAPDTEIIQVVQPKLILANDALFDELRKHPQKLREISPRKFEEVIADILADMGWEVELTPPSNDGGRDILGYVNTGVGKLLCLVEAKHYREDRKVGVALVRSLYGTLCDEHASSAMLVTTSSFTKGAQDLQARHKWQLDLRDYGDVVKWIEEYKKPTPNKRAL